MIRNLGLSVMAILGLTTLAMTAQQPGPTATALPALQGPQSGTLVLGGMWTNCGNVITKVRITVKWTPAVGGAAQTRDYDLDAPPAILGTSQWAFTTPVPTQQNPAPFKVGDTVTATSIFIYNGPPATNQPIASNAMVGQNLKIQ